MGPITAMGSSVYVLDDELGARKVINNARFLSCPEMSIILQCYYNSMCRKWLQLLSKRGRLCVYCGSCNYHNPIKGCI